MSWRAALGWTAAAIPRPPVAEDPPNIARVGVDELIADQGSTQPPAVTDGSLVRTLHLSRAGESVVRSMMTETAQDISQRVIELEQSEFELTRMEEERNHLRRVLLNAQDSNPGTDTRSHRDWLSSRNRAEEHANYCARKRDDLRRATRHAALMVESSRYLANVPGIADGLDHAVNAARNNRSTARAPLAYPVLSTQDYHDDDPDRGRYFYIRRLNIRRGNVDLDNRPFDVDTDDEADAAIRQEQQEQTPGARNAEDEAVEVMAAAETLAREVADFEAVPVAERAEESEEEEESAEESEEESAEESAERAILRPRRWPVEAAVEAAAVIRRPRRWPVALPGTVEGVEAAVAVAARAAAIEAAIEATPDVLVPGGLDWERLVLEEQRLNHLFPWQAERVVAATPPTILYQTPGHRMRPRPEITPPSPTTKENLRTLMALVDAAGEGMKKGEVLSEGCWLEMCNTLKILYAQADVARV